MLESLHISNYALIDNIDIEFFDGLNIITGETGAGKSIILGALSLILGERADTKIIRNPEKKTVIEAIFSVNGYHKLKEFCLSNDIEWIDSQCIIRREIFMTGGRSRAFINDSPVSLSQLQAVALQLVDIHSQHQNRLLSSPEYQLNAIDSLAENGQRLKEYATLYEAYIKASQLLKKTKEAIDKNRSDEDFIRFQLEQLEELNLVAGEQDDLEKDRDIFANMTEIKQLLNAALLVLSNGNDNSLSLLKDAVGYCQELIDVIDEAESLAERLESSRIEIQDIVDTLSGYDNNLNADPQELERIEERLDKIYTLQHKHKVNTVEELIAIRENYKSLLQTMANSDTTIKECEQKVKQTLTIAMEKAKGISVARKAEALKFASELKKRALPLGMKNLRCEISITPTDISASGIDNVEFLFAFNKNQPLMTVSATASGGEISRLMLSLKSILADKMQLPSIIFDEVDTGVSGDIANRVGEMIQSIAQNSQVIAITHLPQVAAKGRNHFKVYKEDDLHSTQTHISHLTPEQRIEEIASMLSGSHIDDAARANARSLLGYDKQNN